MASGIIAVDNWWTDNGYSGISCYISTSIFDTDEVLTLTTDGPAVLNSITIPIGIGQANTVYNTGQYLLCNGGSLNISLRIGSNRSQPQNITNQSGVVGGSSPYPDHTKFVSKTFTFSPGLLLSSAGSYSVFFKKEGGSGNCLCFSAGKVGLGDISHSDPEKKKYTVKYNLQGGQSSSSFPDQTKTQDEDLTLHSGSPTKSGYDFKGWATSSSSTVVSYSPGDKYTQNKNITLYAIWTKKEVTSWRVSYYDADGSSIGIPTQTKQKDVDLKLSSTEPTKNNNEFQGWATSKGSRTIAYHPGDTYKTNADLDLFAVWKKDVPEPTEPDDDPAEAKIHVWEWTGSEWIKHL